jgi:hypothetical protein
MKSLDAILGGFEPKEAERDLKDRAPITIWVPKPYKARYDQLQSASGRRFNKTVREILLAAIEKAEGRAS